MPNASNSPSNNVKISSKLLQIQVEMLDSSRQHFQLSPRSSGQDLFSALLERIGAFEVDYFDLEYINKEGNTCWLDHLKPLCKQHNADKEYVFTFCVKFYAPFPNLLDDEYTRYLFALQIKRDLLRGQLICSENTAALLAAFIVQGEMGDFLEDTFVDRSYLDGRRLVPSTTPEFLEKVMECHRSLIGQTPTEADASLLDTARKVEMYGIRLKSVKGVDGASMNLAVSHAGLFVFQGFSKINTFSWARIRKLSFKRKKFLIKLHPEGYDAVEFFFESRNECKSFWKHCIEHHAFFRCQPVKLGKNAPHVNVLWNSTSTSTGQVHKTPSRGGVCNPSQQSLSAVSCDANSANYQQLQSTSQAVVTPARSLPLTGLDGAGIAAATLGPSFVQLPLGTDCGSLRYPHRFMLVMSRRSEASLGHSVGASIATPAGAASPGSGFLVMLPTSTTDHQQQNAWLSALQQQRQQRPFSPIDSKESAYATLQMNTQSAPNGGAPQDAVGGYAQVLSPASLPSAASGRLVYVDASTGKLIPDRQLLTMPHPSLCMRKCLGRDGSAATSQAPTVANSSVVGDTKTSQGSQDLASLLPFPRRQAVGPLATSTAAPLASSSLPQLIRTHPHGPPPPAPQRRDSVHPRERQLSSSTLDSGITSKSASLSRPSFEASGVDEENENKAPVSPAPLPEVELDDPDPVHPFPFNVIPGSELDFAARRSLQASCLSLATRSLRSSCQSLLHTDCEDMRGHEDGEVEKNQLESPSLSRNHFTSRSASLHRPTVRRGQGSSGVAETSTQDDLATWLANRGSMTGSGDAASGSATSRSLVSLSTAASKNHACDDRFSRSSRRNSVSGSIRSHPQALSSVAFQLLRELTMTERTYKKDLDVVCEGFREAVSEESRNSPAVLTVTSKLFALLDPVRTQAVDFLRELELRYGAWSSRVESTSRHCQAGATAGASTPSSSGAVKAGTMSADGSSASVGPVTDADSAAPFTPIRIGDLFVTNLRMLQLYRSYLRETECLIADLECLVRSRPSFQSKVQSFEALKSCYLPLYAFLLKPMHRLLQYRSVLERLMRHYSESNIDMQDSRVAHARLLDTIQSQWDSYKRCENLYKSLEVERDLVGLGSVQTTAQSNGGEERQGGWLAARSRQFIREGLLQKLSKRGYQQRMFFLFSDQLIYASRTNAAYLQFKVHGQFALHEVMVEEAGTAAAEALSFTVYAGSRCFVVAASSEWQRDRWLEDISRAILAAKSSPTAAAAAASASSALPPTPSSSTAEVDDDSKSEPSELVTVASSSANAAQDASKVLHRATTSVHVCWHRSSTFSMSDILRANEYQTSGYLLRKFKNSNGWQKLWVVFTQLCLFFHKSYQDTYPLASLPLLGYSITIPSPEDNIRKDFVFKLQFKNHVYFFRDDSQTSFERWFDCLSSAAGTSWRQRLAGSRQGGAVSTTPSRNKTQ